jgi:hypothetical protein
MHRNSVPARRPWQTRSLISVARRCLWLLGFTVLGAPQTAWAQAQPAAQGHSDVMAYMLIVFCVALGMIILLRSAGRTSEVRLEDLDDE